MRGTQKATTVVKQIVLWTAQWERIKRFGFCFGTDNQISFIFLMASCESHLRFIIVFTSYLSGSSNNQDMCMHASVCLCVFWLCLSHCCSSNIEGNSTQDYNPVWKRLEEKALSCFLLIDVMLCYSTEMWSCIIIFRWMFMFVFHMNHTKDCGKIYFVVFVVFSHDDVVCVFVQ